jgi:hypothetical protein
VIRFGVLAAALVTAASAAVMAPAVGNAAVCGPGTVYDPASDMCVAAPAPANPAEWNAPAPPPPPPPPLPPISICPPIPFVAVCFPVN